MSVRAVFFDLGGTLFSYGALRDTLGDGLAALAREHQLDAPPDALRSAYAAAMMRVMAEYVDRPFYLHRELFAEAHARWLEGFGVRADDGAASAPEAGAASPFAPEGAGLERIVAREGVRETLERLRAAGLHLAVVSNIDDDQFEAVWGRMGLDDCFDAVTTSEGARSCKPHPRIFEVARAKAGVAAEAVAFVGDSIHHDVAGANAAGMRSVWLSRQAPGPGAPPPDHVIADLRELPELLLA